MSTTPFLVWPDGSEPLVERFTEQTFVERAELSATPTEYRRPSRAFPRYELAGKFVLFDQEREALSAIEAGDNLLVPAWMHRMPAKEDGTSPWVRFIHRNGADKHFLLTNASGDRRLVNTTVTGARTIAAWESGDREAFPVVNARLSEDSFSFESLSPTAHVVSLAFVSDEPQEPVTLQWGTFEALQEELKPDWSQAVRTEVDHSANSFDNGNLRTWQLRHTVKGVSVLFTAIGRDAMLTLRSFLLTRRGRWKSFPWVDPRDGIEKRFRLGSDVLELRYPSEAVMTCAVRLVEVQE